MLVILRKHQHGIMIVVAFIVIVAFAWFFTPGAGDRSGRGSLSHEMAFKIGNKGVTVKEVDRQERILLVASELGFNFTMQLLQPTFDVVDFTQNRYLLGEQARKLGIDPTEEEVQRAIAEHPEFRPSGTFSEDRYLAAIKDTLEPNGLVAGDLRELVADKLRLEKVTELLSSGVQVPPSVVDVEFQRRRERVSASVVDFKLEDFKDQVEVTEEELQAYYDEQKALVPTPEQQLAETRLSPQEERARDLMMSPEMRKAEFVFFAEPAGVSPPSPPSTPPPRTPLEQEPPLLLRPGTSGPAADESLTAPPLELPGEGESLTAPPLELPGEGESLTAPPLEPPTDTSPEENETDESEPPGQAPEEDEAPEEDQASEEDEAPEEDQASEEDRAPLEDAGELEVEPLPTPPVDLDDLDFTPAEDLSSDVNVGGLGDDPPSPPDLDLGTAPDVGFDLEDLDVAPDMTAPPASAADRQAKMQEYLRKVDDFYTEKIMKNPDQFRAEAEAEGLEVKTTDLFPQDEPPTDPKVPQALVTAIFKGSMETDQGVLVPVEGLSPKGWYIARLLEVKEPSEYSFEEVKETLREELIQEKGIEKMEEAAIDAREKLVAALEAGKAFDVAVEELGLTLREIPEFSISKPPTDVENSSEIVEAVGRTTTGAVSEMIRAGDNAMLVYVSQRVAAPETKPDAEVPAVTQNGPPDPDPAEAKKNLAEQLAAQASSGMVNLWFSDRRETAEIERYIDPIIYFPPDLRRSLGF